MIFTLNFHEFLRTMYKYVLNSVLKISLLMFAQYFGNATPLCLGGRFCGHAVESSSFRFAFLYWVALARLFVVC